MNRHFLAGLAVVVAIGLAGPGLAAPAATPKAPAAPADTVNEARLLAQATDAAKTGDKDGAIELYQSAIIYSPSDPVPYQRLAQFFADNRETVLAHQYFGLALDVQPAYPPALAGLAMLDLAAGDRAGAEAQHDILVHACGKTCPETTQVEKAMSGVMDIGSSAK